MLLYSQDYADDLDKNLTKEFCSDGIEFSGGQWQKVAIARMFYSDNLIRILDEPTSSLDPESEIDVLQRLKLNSQNKITFLVTHRLINAKKYATKIILMEKGKITEVGSHDDLMNLNKKYAYLYKQQSSE